MVHETGRSQFGDAQPPSRARKARRVGPDGSRWARPTSSTAELGLSTTRVMLASQARRWAVAAAIGPANSSIAAGAPGAPRRVATVLVTWRWGRCPPTLGTAPASRQCVASSTSAWRSAARGCGDPHPHASAPGDRARSAGWRRRPRRGSRGGRAHPPHRCAPRGCDTPRRRSGRRGRARRCGRGGRGRVIAKALEWMREGLLEQGTLVEGGHLDTPPDWGFRAPLWRWRRGG